MGKVICSECDKEYEIEVQYECVSSDERQMGAELEFQYSDELKCECGNNMVMDLKYWEYPEGCINDTEDSSSGCEVVE